MSNHSQRVKKWLSMALVVALFWFSWQAAAQPAAAQEEDEPEAAAAAIYVTKVDAAAFPLVAVDLIATDDESKPVSSLAELALSENGTAIADFEVSSRLVGVEVVFVIDANRTFNERDGDNLTRREEVRDTIVRFASRFMNQAQLDRVSIVVPDGETGRFLSSDAEPMTFPNEVINAINFYDPGTLRDTPLQEMMEMALERLSRNPENGRFRAVFLLTDGARLNQQLDFDLLVSQAQAHQIAFFAAILGASADPNEITNVSRLYEPTRGFYLHMPGPEDADPFYELLKAHGNQTRLQFRSVNSAGGPRQLVVSLDGATAYAAYEVIVLPPSIRVLIDNSQPIRRVGQAHDTPLSEMEPALQPVVAHVTWPDEHPRTVTAATLIVNGLPEPAMEASPIDPDGLLTVEWPIRELDAGIYNVALQVTDEFGLMAQSEPLRLTVEVERPPVPEPTAVPAVVQEPTAEPTAAGVAGSIDLSQHVGVISIVVGVLAVGFAFLIMIVALVLIRRRQTPAQPSAAPAAPAVTPARTPALDHDATQIMMPAFAVARASGAFLEALENAADHRDPIPVTGGNVAIGRDPNLAQIVLSDKSVSRLHARIMESNGVYRLYDEGSASGTYRNFERVGLTPQVLGDNDDVHIGRVHLRFRLAAGAADADSTQIMAAPPRPGTAAPRPATQQPVDDGLNTQPYMPGQPQAAPGRPQPQSRPGPQAPPAAPPPAPPAAPRHLPPEDPDDVSTQPYMPHSPKR
jgi:hypothetical protein